MLLSDVETALRQKTRTGRSQTSDQEIHCQNVEDFIPWTNVHEVLAEMLGWRIGKITLPCSISDRIVSRNK
jgi:hypothetical protein